MIETDTAHPQARLTRALAWVGFWLCAFALIPMLLFWGESFHPYRLGGALPGPGEPRFWRLAAIYALAATLLTYQIWRNRKKPGFFTAVRTLTPRDRWRSVLALVGLFAVIFLRIMASQRAAPPNWVGVFGGAVGFGLLCTLLFRCGELALRGFPGQGPLPGPLQALRDTPSVTGTDSAWVRPPRNSYLAEKSAHRVVYRRPLAKRIGYGIISLIMILMCAGAVWTGLLCLALIPALPRTYIPYNPWLAALMLLAFVMIGGLALQTFSRVGTQELRVSLTDHTYTLLAAAPLPFRALLEWMDRSPVDAGGIPWRIREYAGPCADMAGVDVRELSQQSSAQNNIWYSLFLRWNIPDRPGMQMGLVRGAENARALQAQIAADLGIPALTDNVSTGRVGSAP